MNKQTIQLNDIIQLLCTHQKKYVVLDKKTILLQESDDFHTIISIEDDHKSVAYEGKIIGGLKELEQML